MKVIHVITGLNDGGAEAVLYHLCTHDRSYNYTVVSLMDEGKYGLLLESYNLDVHYLNMPAGKITFSGLCQLFKLINELKPDVVQTWMYHADLIGGVIARLAGSRNVVWGLHHTVLIRKESKRSTILVAKINALLSKFIPKKIIYCAHKSKEAHESIGYNAKIGYVVENGYDITKFIPNNIVGYELRSEINICRDVFVIGHVGRFNALKDYPNLISALALVEKVKPNVKFVFVGSNISLENQELINLISKHNLQNIPLLMGKRDDISSVMNCYDLFVLSSSSEAFPNVLNEAMACGTPCVTTDVGDAAFIVGDTGWVVPPKNSQKLADAILLAMDEKLTKPDAWLYRKTACRVRIVNNFSLETMIYKYHQVWNEAIVSPE